MSVQLDPPELGFKRPFTNEVTQLLRLSNSGTDPIAFKVKTTAPKQYCVRPNSGRIEVGSKVEVHVLLQAMQQEPPPDARCRDKFLVQSISITPDRELGSTSAIWQHVEKTAKDAIEEKKIRVVFLPSEGQTTTPKHHSVNGPPGDDAPPAYGSASPYGTPAPEATTSTSRSQKLHETRPELETNSTPDFEKKTAATSSSVFSAATSSINAAVPGSTEELQNQLAKAKAKITDLTSRNEAQGLRQRNSSAANQELRAGTDNVPPGLGVHHQTSNGVPVQIVAALCLLSFLLAYFFF